MTFSEKVTCKFRNQFTSNESVFLLAVYFCFVPATPMLRLYLKPTIHATDYLWKTSRSHMKNDVFQKLYPILL